MVSCRSAHETTDAVPPADAADVAPIATTNEPASSAASTTPTSSAAPMALPSGPPARGVLPPLTDALRNDLIACADELDHSRLRHPDSRYDVSVHVGHSAEAIVEVRGEGSVSLDSCLRRFGDNVVREWFRRLHGMSIGAGATFYVVGPAPRWRVEG